MKTQAPKVEQAALFVCVAIEEHVKPLINVINVARTLKSLQWKSFAIFFYIFQIILSSPLIASVLINPLTYRQTGNLIEILAHSRVNVVFGLSVILLTVPLCNVHCLHRNSEDVILKNYLSLITSR